MRCLPTESSGSAQGFTEKWLKACLNVFSPENVYYSSVGHSNKADVDERSCRSGAFGFIRMLGLSASETSFLSKVSALERCLFALLQSEEPPSVECYGDLSKLTTLGDQRKDTYGHAASAVDCMKTSVDLLDDEDCEDARTRCVRRMLMLPSRADLRILRVKHPSGPELQPFESLVVSNQDRLLGTTGLLRSVRKYMPPVRAPQVCDSTLLIIQ